MRKIETREELDALECGSAVYYHLHYDGSHHVTASKGFFGRWLSETGIDIERDDPIEVNPLLPCYLIWTNKDGYVE